MNHKLINIIYNKSKSSYFLLSIFLIYSSSLYSQSITQDVIGSAGGTYEQSNGSMQYNIGEPMIETYIQPNQPQMYLGFEQGSYSLVGVEENRIIPNLEVALYPNPSNGVFYLQLDRADIQDFKLRVNDQMGKLIMQNNPLKDVTTLVNLSAFDIGFYHLVVANEKLNYVKTFKIVKR